MSNIGLTDLLMLESKKVSTQKSLVSALINITDKELRALDFSSLSGDELSLARSASHIISSRLNQEYIQRKVKEGEIK